MFRSIHATLVAAIVALAGRQLSAQLVVGPGGSYSTIQSALDAAQPGQVVLVNGGTHDGPIVISKPVTVIGSGKPKIQHGLPGFPSGTFRCVELSGPGSGKVVIAGFDIGSMVFGWLGAIAYPAISGQGFDELDIVRCSVRGPMWNFMTGSAYGKPALEVTIPKVVVASSDLQGGMSNTDWNYDYVPSAPTGVIVAGTLSLIDSIVKPTPASPPLVFLSSDPGQAPCPCPQLYYFIGGTGVHATTVYLVNSTVTGGPGSAVYVKDPVTGLWNPWGTQPSGPAFSSSTIVHEVPALGLEAPLPMRLGQYWHLDYPIQWSWSTLYLGTDASIPYDLGPDVAFMDQVAGAVPLMPMTTSIGFVWPNDPAWLGLETVWQLYDPLVGLSRPVFDVLMP